MRFLEKIDELHRETRAAYGIAPEQGEFFSFIPVALTQDGGETCRYLIRKGQKAELLLLDGKQRVYLTDADIIETILAMGDEEIQWFLGQFAALCQGGGSPVQICLGTECFDGLGLAVYPEEKELKLFSDTAVTFRYFCGLLSFIVCKDRCWEELSEKAGVGQKTLCKYISLIDFYSSGSDRSRGFLEAIGYPLTGENPKPYRAKEVWKLFDDLSILEQFDISNYL